MDELSLDNILDSNEIENLFVSNETEDVQPTEKKEDENNEIKENTTEVNPNDLFEGEPESVGSGDNNIEEKEDTTSKKDGSSPNNFYYSIAKAFGEDGIFPDLDKEACSKVKNAEDFRALIEEQIKANFDERQKRIDDALNAGVESSEIRKYENTINYLDSLSDTDLSDEGDKGENLRKQLIYQDFINRGYSKERANREISKSFNGGTDIEDAKEALKSVKDFFQGQYDDLINDAKAEEEKVIKARKEQFENLKKSILEDKNVFGELSVDNHTRQKVYDNITKPIYKDPDTGEIYTAIQKYEMDNRVDFLKNIGLIYTLTNGFKNLDGLIKSKVNKKVKEGLKSLEATLNNTSRNLDGSIKFVTGVNDDPESIISKGWQLDI